MLCFPARKLLISALINNQNTPSRSGECINSIFQLYLVCAFSSFRVVIFAPQIIFLNQFCKITRLMEKYICIYIHTYTHTHMHLSKASISDTPEIIQSRICIQIQPVKIVCFLSSRVMSITPSRYC